MSILVIAAIAGAAAWATLEVLRPPAEAAEETSFAYAQARPGQVGSSLNLTTTATWPKTSAGTNQAQGTVTEVLISPGDMVTSGQALYTVDLRPVVAAVGSIPAFRVIEESTQGQDVAQLQRMLGSLGYYGGPDDGKAGGGTISAIRAWQEASGTEVTGAVAPGDVVFVPSLPARVDLSDSIQRGKILAGGEDAVALFEESPVLELIATESQAAAIPTGTSVEVTAPDGATWPAQTSGSEVDGVTQSVTIHLTAPSGGAVCADQCSQIPVTEETRLNAKVVTLPTVSGIIVPSAALATDATGGMFVVIGEDGARTVVSVLASAQGMSVVDGVDDGMQVRVPPVEGVD